MTSIRMIISFLTQAEQCSFIDNSREGALFPPKRRVVQQYSFQDISLVEKLPPPKRVVSDSDLTATTVASEASCSSLWAGVYDERSVSFGSVQVREYERVLDEYPELDGPALAIGWDYDEHDTVEFDDYEDIMRQNQEIKKKEQLARFGWTCDYALPLSSSERGNKFVAYGFQGQELEVEVQRMRERREMREAAAAQAANLKKKKLSYKLKKRLIVSA